eukprot:14096520-Heterocapsa_arctica.AAC.1
MARRWTSRHREGAPARTAATVRSPSAARAKARRTTRRLRMRDGRQTRVPRTTGRRARISVPVQLEQARHGAR